MGKRSIELVFFEGCPNVDRARANLRSALQATGADLTWREWDLRADGTPRHLTAHGSPTVLIDGHDVTGDTDPASAMACRTDGVPSAALILEKLR